jgi:putative membrane protein
VLGLALGVALYVTGWRRMTATRRGRAALPAWRAWAYGAGLALVGLALLSPIATFSAVFFFMHMLQHMLLLTAAPLLLLASPLVPVLWALPGRLRREIGLLFVPSGPLHAVSHAVTHPVVGAAVLVTTLGIWHAPSFYDAAQGKGLIHDLEHLMFLGSGFLYWWPLIHPAGGRRRLSYGLGLFYLAPSVVIQNAIGMVLTFADRPLYQAYIHGPRLWGISIVHDQQLAGAVMGALGGGVNLAAMTALVFLLLGGSGKSSRRPAGIAGHTVK